MPTGDNVLARNLETGWLMVLDPRPPVTPFFFNVRTKEVCWEWPADFEAQTEKPKGATAEARTDGKGLSVLTEFETSEVASTIRTRGRGQAIEKSTPKASDALETPPPVFEKVLDYIRPVLQTLQTELSVSSDEANVSFLEQVSFIIDSTLRSFGGKKEEDEIEVERKEDVKVKDEYENVLLSLDEGATAVAWAPEQVQAALDTMMAEIGTHCDKLLQESCSGPEWQALPHFSIDAKSTDIDTYEMEQRLATCVTSGEDDVSHLSKLVYYSGFSRQIAHPKREHKQTGINAAFGARPGNQEFAKADTAALRWMGNEEWYNFRMEERLPPIVDIKVLYGTKNEEEVPAGYHMVWRSIEGMGANLNKNASGLKRMYIVYRRHCIADDPPLVPIVSLALIFTGPEYNEQIPYGFELLDNALMDGGYDGNLNSGPFPIWLCLARGKGAPIDNLQVLFNNLSPMSLRPSWNVIVQTHTGVDANVNPNGIPTRLCFKNEINSLMLRFKRCIDELSEELERASEPKYDLELSRGLGMTLACLVAAFNSGGVAAMAAIDAFAHVPTQKIAPELANVFVACMCDSWPFIRTTLRASVEDLLNFLLESVFYSLLPQISPANTLKLIELFASVNDSGADYKYLERMVTQLFETYKRLAPKPATKTRFSMELSAKDICRQVVGSIIDRICETKTLNTLVLPNIPLQTGDGLMEVTLTALDTFHMCAADVHTTDVYNTLRSARVSEVAHHRDPSAGLDELDAEVMLTDDLDDRNMARRMSQMPEEATSGGKSELRYLCTFKTSMFAGAQSVVVEVNFEKGAIAFVRIQRGRQKRSNYSRETLIKVKKVKSKECLVEFGQPKAYKCTLRCENEKKRDEFYANVQNKDQFRMAVVDKESQDLDLNSRTQTFDAISFSGASSSGNLPPISRVGAQATVAGALGEVFQTVDLGELEPCELDSRIVHRLDVLGIAKIEDMLVAAVVMCHKLAFVPDISPPGIHNVLTSTRKITSMKAYGSVVLHTFILSIVSLVKDVNDASFPQKLINAVRNMIMPAVVSLTMSSFPDVFNRSLQCFGLLWNRLKTPLISEMGSMINHLSEMLASSYVAPIRKIAILQLLSTVILNSAELHIQIFSHFDARSIDKDQTVMRNLIRKVSRLCVGNARDFWSGSKGTVSITDAKVSCCAFLAQIVASAWHFLEEEQSSKYKPAARKKSDDSEAGMHTCRDSSEVGSLSVTVSAVSSSSVTPTRPRKHSNFANPYSKLMLREELMKKALASVSESGKLAKGITVLKEYCAEHEQQKSSNLYEKCDWISMTIDFFVNYSDQLDAVEVGDMLGAAFPDKNFTETQFLELRRKFISRMDFTGLSLDVALRSFLVDQVFRLPGEAQKIDRLVEEFTVVYFRQNPESPFGSKDGVFLVAFAMIMLNTDIHDARLKTGKAASRKQMTEAEFVRNLRGQNDKEDFPKWLLKQMYNGIKKEAIEMPSFKPPGASDEEKDTAGEGSSMEEWKKARDASWDVLLRQTLAKLRLSNVLNKKLWDYSSKPAALYSGFFQSCGEDFLTAFENATKELDLMVVETSLSACEMAHKIMDRLQPESATTVKFKDTARLLQRRKKLLRIKQQVLKTAGPHALVKDRRLRVKLIPSAIVGSELVDWLVVQNHAPKRADAVALGQELVDTIELAPVTPGDTFKDDKNMYTFVEHVVEWGSAITDEEDYFERDSDQLDGPEGESISSRPGVVRVPSHGPNPSKLSKGRQRGGSVPDKPAAVGKSEPPVLTSPKNTSSIIKSVDGLSKNTTLGGSRTVEEQKLQL